MNAPDFRAVAAAQREERETAASERARMRASIDRDDPRTPIGSAAERICALLASSCFAAPSDAEIRAVCCALYRALDHNHHIHNRAMTLIALHDIVGDHV